MYISTMMEDLLEYMKNFLEEDSSEDEYDPAGKFSSSGDFWYEAEHVDNSKY